MKKVRNQLMDPIPEGRSLVKATITSLVIAMVTLILVILPAEYNIDPTGIGQKLGLTIFNEETREKVASNNIDSEKNAVVLTIPAGKGIEYKLSMSQFSKVTYEWVSGGGSLYVDLHGEPKGDTTGYFESYAVATLSRMKGSFTAPFEGSHGWYWQNNSDTDIQVQLIFNGDYDIEGLK